MTKHEQLYISKVVNLGCFLCRAMNYGASPAEAHHVREGQGMGQRSAHWLTIPVCSHHHRHNIDGLHGQRKAWKLAGFDELDALADTIKALNEKI